MKKTYKVKRTLNFLLAEDNIFNQMIIITKIKQIGHKIDLAKNGKEAVEMFNLKTYDIILMDLMMPIMDGFEATSIIRNSEKNKDKKTPIIAVTANALDNEKEKCLKIGMDNFMNKPFSIEELNKIFIKLGLNL
ncbi:MAG: hypothetical protein B6I24_09270 [Bacteroidetes bacterium 4572_128]|nr:MAG: hypothetical protein B6I24_09270 [Bacteroidetes bacterium 4572_128]